MIYWRDQTHRFRGFAKDLRAFPVAVRGEIGQSIFEAQLGEHPRNAKPLKGFSGVLEIRDNFDGDTYRTVYTTRLEGVLDVLLASQKKSTSEIATPQSTSTRSSNACGTLRLFKRQQKETYYEHQEEGARPQPGLRQHFR
jgi:phage-related protein